MTTTTTESNKKDNDLSDDGDELAEGPPPFETLDPIAAAEANAASMTAKGGDDVPPEKPPAEKPKKSKAKKKKGPAAPNVAPLSAADEVREPFADGPPEPSKEEGAVAPAVVAPKKPKRKIKVDAKKFAAKTAEALDNGSQMLAQMRYKSLTMPWQVPPTTENPSGQITVPIASLAAASPDEKKEIEEAFADVIEGWGLEVTPEMLAAGLAIWTYGKRLWIMEKTARELYGAQREAQRQAAKEQTPK